MNEIVKLILTFVIGGLVGRYLEQLVKFLSFMRDDIQKLRAGQK